MIEKMFPLIWNCRKKKQVLYYLFLMENGVIWI